MFFTTAILARNMWLNTSVSNESDQDSFPLRPEKKIQMLILYMLAHLKVSATLNGTKSY